MHSLKSPTGTLYQPKTSIHYHPNGEIVAISADNTVAIWDNANGKCVHVLNGHSGVVNSSAFSSNGDYIVTASNDNTIKIWSSTSGNLLATISDPCPVDFASFSPDGNQIISASHNGTIKIWDFPALQDLIDQTRERFEDRSLTDEERRMYFLEE